MSKPTDPFLLKDIADFSRSLKQAYTLSGEPTAEGKAMLERIKAGLRVDRNKDIAGLIDERGRPTVAGIARIQALRAALDDVQRGLIGHDDNTGASCRIDLDGHDCCAICNAAEDMLRATAKYYEGR